MHAGKDLPHQFHIGDRVSVANEKNPRFGQQGKIKRLWSEKDPKKVYEVGFEDGSEGVPERDLRRLHP